MKIETIAIHAANHVDASSKAVIQPIVLSTTFERAADGSYPANTCPVNLFMLPDAPKNAAAKGADLDAVVDAKLPK